MNSEHPFPNEICAADSRGRGWIVNTPSQTKSVQQIYEAGDEQWTPLPKRNPCSRFTRQGVNSEYSFPNEICAADSRSRGWAENTPSQTKSVQQIHEAGGEQLTSLPKRNLCSRFTRQGVNSEHPSQTKSVQQIYEAGGEQWTPLPKGNLWSRFTRQWVSSEHPFPNEICAADSRGRGWTVNTPSQTKSVQQIHEAGGEQLTSLPKRNLCSRFTRQGVNSEHPFPNKICAADLRGRGWTVNTPSQTKSVQQIHEAVGEQLTPFPKRNLCSRFTRQGVNSEHPFPNEICAADSRGRGWTVNTHSQTKSVQQIHGAGGEYWTPLTKRNLCSRFTRQGVSSEHPFPNEVCAADSRCRGWIVNTPSQTKSVQQIHEAGDEQRTPLPKRNLCSRFTRQGVNSEYSFPNEICAADSRSRGWAENTPSQTKSVQQNHEAGGEHLTSLPKRNLCSRFTRQGVNSEHPFPNKICAADLRCRGWTVNTPSQLKSVQQIHEAVGEQLTPFPKRNLCSRFTRQGVNSEHPFPNEICAADSRGRGWTVNTHSQTKSVQQIHGAGGE